MMYHFNSKPFYYPCMLMFICHFVFEFWCHEIYYLISSSIYFFEPNINFPHNPILYLLVWLVWTSQPHQLSMRVSP
jgi:hypothetical protein